MDATREKAVSALLDKQELTELVTKISRGVDLSDDLIGVFAEALAELPVDKSSRVIRHVLIARGAVQLAVVAVVGE